MLTQREWLICNQLPGRCFLRGLTALPSPELPVCIVLESLYTTGPILSRLDRFASE